MKKNLLYMLTAAAMLAGCAKNDVVDSEINKEGNLIGFSTYKNISRGNPVDNNNEFLTKDNAFGVTAFIKTGAGETPNASPYMGTTTEGIQIVSDGTKWTYAQTSDQAYWPVNGELLKFYAYSPYANQGDPYTSLSSTSSTAGYPQLTYTVPDDVITQRDLLVSVPLLNQTKTSRNADGKLPLTFRHALSCIVFNAKMTDACDFPVKVTSITLGNFKNKATLSYDVSNTPGTFSWTMAGDASDKPYLLTINNGLLEDVNLKTITNTYQSISTDNAFLMLLPQAIDETDEIKVTVEYQVTGIIIFKLY